MYSCAKFFGRTIYFCKIEIEKIYKKFLSFPQKCVRFCFASKLSLPRPAATNNHGGWLAGWHSLSATLSTPAQKI
jgi:hypothetical protein